MKTAECHETSRYAKIFDLGAFFVDHFGPQSSGRANFGCHFDPVTPIAQGPDFTEASYFVLVYLCLIWC